MKDLFTVRLEPKLRQNNHPDLAAKAQVSSNDVLVIVSTKRIRKTPERK